LFARLGLAFEEMEPERNEPGACHKTSQPAVPA
jgi:biotin synthase